MNWALFLSVFSLIFVAELPDKTAFATLLMATRGRPWAIFLGVACAFFIQTLVAVTFGHFIAYFPERYVHLGAGILFIGFALHTWFFHDKEEAETEEEAPELSEGMAFFKTCSKAFMVVFVAEWGDLTQLATASMAARYKGEEVSVFFGALLALWSVTAIAVTLGHKVKHVIHAAKLKVLSTIAFAAVGIYFIYTSL